MTLTMLNNKTVHIVNNSLTLEGEARLGSARVMGNVTVGSNGYVYAIDQVLGVPLASDGTGYYTVLYLLSPPPAARWLCDPFLLQTL
jgi:hypothetical protein